MMNLFLKKNKFFFLLGLVTKTNPRLTEALALTVHNKQPRIKSYGKAKLRLASRYGISSSFSNFSKKNHFTTQ